VRANRSHGKRDGKSHDKHNFFLVQDRCLSHKQKQLECDREKQLAETCNTTTCTTHAKVTISQNQMTNKLCLKISSFHSSEHVFVFVFLIKDNHHPTQFFFCDCKSLIARVGKQSHKKRNKNLALLSTQILSKFKTVKVGEQSARSLLFLVFISQLKQAKN
jgi:predicted nucleic acid-binding Zn finger protein